MATEDERIRMLDEGFAVVGTMRTVRSIGVDHDVVEYAKARGLVVRIDRQTDWGNPFPMASEDERDLVCERYESYVRANPELMARVPSPRASCSCAGAIRAAATATRSRRWRMKCPPCPPTKEK